MFDPVRLILLWNYYYGRLMGVINFEIDMSTGKAKVTRTATFYAAMINILLFSTMPVMSRVKVWNVFWTEMRGFHEYVFVTVMFLRIACVLLTILNRWWQRHQIICLLGHFRRLVLEQPQVMKLWRRGVFVKCTTSVLIEFCQIAVSLNGLRYHLSLYMTLSVLAMCVLMALLNIVISQYYFALQNLHGHYVLFNEKLRSILEETQSLELDQRKGVRILRSCDLADRIDNLAYLQSELQSVIQRMSKIFGLQTLCLGIILYMSLLGGFYFTFLIIKHNMKRINFFSLDTFLLIFGVSSYFADIHVTYSITYNLYDQHDELKYLIVQYTSFVPDLDVRLQKAFVNFQLQLLRNPLELSVMGLYNGSRGIIVPMVDSLISHILVLIQYDIQNY